MKTEMDKIQELIAKNKQITTQIKKYESEIRNLRDEAEENSIQFLIDLVKPYFDFKENFSLLPIDKNLFLKEPIVQYSHKREDYEFYGVRHEFQGGKLISSGRHDSISVTQWLNLSDEIKSGNFKSLQEENAHFSYTGTNYTNEYRAGITLCENEDFLLSWMKSTTGIPGEMILFAKNNKPETIQHYKDKLEILSIESLSSNRFRYVKNHNMHHLVDAQERFSSKTVDKNSSFIIQFFGEEKIDEIKTKIKNMKANKRTVNLAPPKPQYEHIDIGKLQL